MENRVDKEQYSPTYNINYLLRIYTLNFNTYEIDFAELLAFLKRYLEQDNQTEVIREYASQTEKRLSYDLELLNSEDNCSLQYLDGKILKIHFPRFFIDKIYRVYKRMEDDIEIPFPTEESLGIAIPRHLISVINIKQDFIKILSANPEAPVQIIRLLFPDIINSILITSDLVIARLLDYAVYKIKLYMEKKRNASYIENKIFPIFRQQSRSLKEMINNIVLHTGQTIASIKEPSDFSFRFWAHFANLIIQEYKQKNDMLPIEHDYCQAAYIIGFFNVFYRSIHQKEKEKQIALKQFESQLRKPPYIFTLTDLYGFKDPNGYPLLNKYSREFLTKIIERKIQPADATSLPELVRLVTSDGKDCYIHKASVMIYCLRLIHEVSQAVRKSYINHWIEVLRDHKKIAAMTDEMKFIRELTDKVQLNYPVLAALLNNYYLLYLANEEFPVRNTNTAHLFDRTSRSLQPMNVILGLDRQELLAEAKTYLPFWESIPILRLIIHFFKKLFLGIRSVPVSETEKITQRINAKYNPTISPEDYADLDPDSEPITASESGIGTNPSLIPKLRANYKKAILELRDHFVGKTETMNTRLEFLAEKWNPLYDSIAKQNLVQDVNAMIRDYLRTLKRGFRVKPPTIQRISQLAATLATNQHFDEIKKKHFLKMYIEVYMVKVLGENKF